MSDGLPDNLEIGHLRRETSVSNLKDLALKEKNKIMGEVAAKRERARSGEPDLSFGRDELGFIGWVGFKDVVKPEEMARLQIKYAETLDSMDREDFLRLRPVLEGFQVIEREGLEKGVPRQMCWVLRSEGSTEDAEVLADRAEGFSDWLAVWATNRK
jgi:hypothetical protein